MKSVTKHVTLSEGCIEILDGIIDKNQSIDSYSEAIRYTIYKYSEASGDADSKDNMKLNQMAKDLSILVEMVAGGFEKSKVGHIGTKEECIIYKEAKQNVERDIQRAVTRRNYKQF